VPWLQGGCQVRLVGSTSMDGFVAALGFNSAFKGLILHSLQLVFIILVMLTAREVRMEVFLPDLAS